MSLIRYIYMQANTSNFTPNEHFNVRRTAASVLVRSSSYVAPLIANLLCTLILVNSTTLGWASSLPSCASQAAMSSSAVLAAVGAVASAYVFLWALLQFTQDSREPPAVLQTIPFLSPILGMMRWSMEFYPHMR